MRTEGSGQKTSPASCPACAVFARAWQQFEPAIYRVRLPGRGRPRHVPASASAVRQCAWFVGALLNHLREIERTPRRDALTHLRANGMERWVPAVRSVQYHLRLRDDAWGEPGLVSERRWQRDGQWQAVRRFLWEALPVDGRTGVLNGRTLRRLNIPQV